MTASKPSPDVSTPSHRLYWFESARSLSHTQHKHTIVVIPLGSNHGAVRSPLKATAKTLPIVQQAQHTAMAKPGLCCCLLLVKLPRNRQVEHFDKPTERTYKMSAAYRACVQTSVVRPRLITKVRTCTFEYGGDPLSCEPSVAFPKPSLTARNMQTHWANPTVCNAIDHQYELLNMATNIRMLR